METSYRPGDHKTLECPLRFFLIVCSAGGDLNLPSEERWIKKQGLQSLQPYADWVVIGLACRVEVRSIKVLRDILARLN